MDYLVFEVAFGKEKHNISLPGDSLVEDLKAQIVELVGVSANNQKLVGLPKAADDAPLRSLALKRPSQKIMLMGTRDEALRAAKAAEEAAAAAAQEAAEASAADVVEGGDEEINLDPDDVSSNPKFLALCDKRVDNYKPKVIAGLRPDAKALLVLDIDYTLIDHRSVAETPIEMMRPFLHDMLAAAYAAGYDIIIWSATGMSWIEVKMREMGVTR